MTGICSFFTDRKFYAERHFPYGITRSGEFTCEQGELLINHGAAYEAIATGNRKPVTDEEKRFLAVCRGQRVAESAHEKVWQLYLNKISNAKPAVQSPGMRSASGAVDFAGTVVDSTI